MVVSRTLLMIPIPSMNNTMTMMTIIKTPTKQLLLYRDPHPHQGLVVKKFRCRRCLTNKAGCLKCHTETSFGGRRNITDEEIERRPNSLRNPITGVLDITTVGPHENLFSFEDQQKEIQRVKDYTLKNIPTQNFGRGRGQMG